MTDFQNNYQRDLIATVVHELKTPIAAVRGFIELVEQTGPLNATQSRYSERAMGALQRMEMLVVSLLEMARLESDVSLSFAQCDLQVLIEDAVEMIQGMAEKRSITLQIEIEEEARYVQGDAGLLNQVISNLMSNAVKYNREGGQIFVSAIAASQDQVQIEVRDTGMGMDSGDLARVFEPFTRLRTGERIEGSGLGLWIADTIVRKHGGRIWVESTLGEGSVFRFTLPRMLENAF
jgi:signal transduction histidine kinase